MRGMAGTVAAEGKERSSSMCHSQTPPHSWFSGFGRATELLQLSASSSGLRLLTCAVQLPQEGGTLHTESPRAARDSRHSEMVVTAAQQQVKPRIFFPQKPIGFIMLWAA